MSADLWPSLGSTGRRAACCTQQTRRQPS